MAIKRARTTKSASGCGSGSSVAMTEMPPHGPGGANHVQAPPPLPPGVYFSPTREECLGFLNRWIAGDNDMADARGYIFGANVYGESPDALRRRHPPASIRGPSENTWWFLSETRFQSQTVGGGASKRADRRVESGGYWRLEQSKEELKQSKEEVKQSKKGLKQSKKEVEQSEEEAEGVKNSFGFYLGSKKEDKTPWLMQEFTSANDDGAGKRGVPALYRVYMTPRATEETRREIFGEHGMRFGPDGKKKKPARAMVPQEYFDAIAELLPEGSVRGGVVQEHVQEAPPPPVGLLDYHGQQGRYVDQHQQHEQYLAPYHHQQQHEQYVGPYQQQQGPFSSMLLGGIAADETLSMPMDEFLGVIDGHPAGMDDEQPAETVKGGEPDWASLPNIVDHDELKFSKKD